ncbi:MAG TPA: putative sulfate exporter family transporter [Patescibacteria group bacterium]|nr:putative sulfate exporter family transporter [Patescibacteria group bacterium]
MTLRGDGTVYLPGLIYCIVIGLGSYAVAPLLGLRNAYIVALLTGILMTKFFENPRLTPGINFSRYQLMTWTIGLLGLTAGRWIARYLVEGILITVVIIPPLHFLGRILGSRLGVDKHLSFLITTGIALDGAPTIVEKARRMDVDEREIQAAIKCTLLMGSVAAVIYALFIGSRSVYGFEDDIIPLWIGASLPDAAFLMAASGDFGIRGVTVSLAVFSVRSILGSFILDLSLSKKTSYERPISRTLRSHVSSLGTIFLLGWIIKMIFDGLLTPLSSFLIYDEIANLVILPFLILTVVAGAGSKVDLNRLRGMPKNLVLYTLCLLIIQGLLSIALAGLASFLFY